MLQYPPDSSPFVFSDGRKKTSSSTSDHNNPPSKSKYLNPNSSVTRKLNVDTDLSASSHLSPSLPQLVPRPSRPSSTQARSTKSSQIEDILSPGDLVGEGIPLLGEVLRLVPIQSPEQSPVADYEVPAAEFEVVRQLGIGSYAVVYLVREVLSRSPPSEDDHVYPDGRLELDDAASMRPPTEYGRQYAIKLLSKADLDEEELVAQLTETTTHQSLPVHPNVVTLHRTLETSAFLLLLLEFVPGQDLFYFLEQARDHYDVDPTADPALTHTPPTPGLLSSLHPSQLLSPTRLRLIASMFAQMCEAVATCHDASVFHRDIKPESFIVTDGWILSQGIRERKVVVKLCDFGLSTRDAVSSDMDCGSAPYMSYECRNNVTPVYKPRAADVWSLGIVLINMIYHCNPWSDTVKDGCSSFDQYLSNPTDFFMKRFAGMTLPVANFLVENVFCILDEPTDDSQRIGAHEFGVWVRDLPTLMGTPQPVTHGHSRVPPAASIATGHTLASAPASRCPSSHQASAAGDRPVGLHPLTRDASPGPVLDRDSSDGAAHPALCVVLDEENEEEEQKRSQESQQHTQNEQQNEVEVGRSSTPLVRSTSNTKRRKRGRKYKGMTLSSDHIQTSELLASASQTLARELSRQTRSASASVQSFPDVPPAPPIPVPTSMPTVTKKPSRWRLSFGKSAGEAALNNTRSDSHSSPNASSARAANVLNLIMGLSPPPNPSQPKSPSPLLSPFSPPETSEQGRGDELQQQQPRRPASPTSVPKGQAVANVSSAASSRNRRHSVASTDTSTSTFTRYSGQSMRSVSTYATTVSTSSVAANMPIGRMGLRPPPTSSQIKSPPPPRSLLSPPEAAKQVIPNSKRGISPRLAKPKKHPDADQIPAIPSPYSPSGLGAVRVTTPTYLSSKSLVERTRGASSPGPYQPTAHTRTADQGDNTYDRALPPVTVPSNPHLSRSGTYPSRTDIFPQYGGDWAATQLHYASRRGLLEVARVFLEHGADATAQDEHGWTPLHQASSRGRLEVVRLFLENGCVTPHDKYRWTPLHLASRGGHVQVARLLLEHGMDAGAQDKDGSTPLHMASRGGHVQVAETLLRKGTDPTLRNKRGCTPLHWASPGGHVCVARVLLHNNADACPRDENNMSPLHLASMFGRLGVVRLLLDHGENLNAENEDQQTPLFLASRDGRLEVAEFLLMHGADSNRHDWMLRSPLHVASENGHHVVTQLLIEEGADVNAKDAHFWTPLHLASKTGKLTVAKVLLDCGAKIGAQNDLRRTPLHMASQEGNREFVQLLLDYGADVGILDGNGETALHLAAYHGHLQVTTLLLERGAKGHVQNYKYKTPNDLASKEGYLEVAQLLSVGVCSEGT